MIGNPQSRNQCSVGPYSDDNLFDILDKNYKLALEFTFTLLNFFDFFLHVMSNNTVRFSPKSRRRPTFRTYIKLTLFLTFLISRKVHPSVTSARKGRGLLLNLSYFLTATSGLFDLNTSRFTISMKMFRTIYHTVRNYSNCNRR